MAKMKTKLEKEHSAIAQKTFQKGLESSNLIELPLGAVSLRLSVKRNAWPLTSELAFFVSPSISHDNGVTWIPRPGFGAYGGESQPHYATGEPQNESACDYELLEPENPNRLFRFDFESNYPIDSEIVVFPSTAKDSKEMSLKVKASRGG